MTFFYIPLILLTVLIGWAFYKGLRRGGLTRKITIVILIILGVLVTRDAVRVLMGATAKECQERLPRYERCAGGCNLVWPHSEYLNSECLKDCIRSNKVEKCFTLDGQKVKLDLK